LYERTLNFGVRFHFSISDFFATIASGYSALLCFALLHPDSL